KYYHLASQDVHRALDLLSSNEEDDVRRQRLEQRLQQCLRHKAEDEQIINDDNTQLEHELEQLKLNQTFNTNYSSLTSHAD
ncbi:unnamed protein product, partial [Rotaria magnacalcarata]